MAKKIKKLLLLGVMVIMAFSHGACGDKSLAEYKANAKAKLDAYVASMNENDYTTENWTKILGFVATGRKEIDEVADKEQVDATVATAKQKINNIPTKVEVGMDVEIKSRILQDYCNGLNDTDIALQDVYIRRFYGKYDDSIAVIMAIKDRVPPPAIDEVTIAVFEFTFNAGYHILIWNDGTFHDLQKAYDESLITLEDLETIHELYSTAGL